MKKRGFTLAEVLITLGIIGVIAATVLPTVMINHTFKTVGVRLAKFNSQIENSTRAFVVDNRGFSEDNNFENVNSFLEDTILIKNDISEFKSTNSDGTEIVSILMQDGNAPERNSSETGFSDNGDITNITNLIKIKDGTSMYAYPLSNYDEQKDINTYKVGEVVFGITFDPNVNGLPKTNQKSYDFVVTELGYVYPNKNDICTLTIYNNDYQTTSKIFKEGSACALKKS